MKTFGKKLVDSGACGVRLGADLRVAAQREAALSRMSLSKWVKELVQRNVSSSPGPTVHTPSVHNVLAAPNAQEVPTVELDSVFEYEWTNFLRGLYGR
jgi:hypothetical protein